MTHSIKMFFCLLVFIFLSNAAFSQKGGTHASAPPVDDETVEAWIDDLLDDNYQEITYGQSIYFQTFSGILDYAKTDDDREYFVTRAIDVYNAFNNDMKRYVLTAFRDFQDVEAVRSI